MKVSDCQRLKVGGGSDNKGVAQEDFLGWCSCSVSMAVVIGIYSYVKFIGLHI